MTFAAARYGGSPQKCSSCGLLYQPFLTHDQVEPGQLRSEEDSPHEGCMQRRCKCGEGDYCPPDADAAPIVGATPTPAPSAWGTATSAALPSSWGSVDVPPFPGLQQEEKQPADPPSDPAAGGSSCGGNAPVMDGSDATEDEESDLEDEESPLRDHPRRPRTRPRTRQQVVEDAETGVQIALSSTPSVRTRSMYGTP